MLAEAEIALTLCRLRRPSALMRKLPESVEERWWLGCRPRRRKREGDLRAAVASGRRKVW